MQNIPNLEDIATKNVIFYESNYEDKLLDFCEENNIDRLPGYEGSYKYIREDESFQKKDIQESEKVRATRRALNTEIMEKFSDEEFLFVYRQGELIGIAHYCDYNSSEVYEYLYHTIFEVETDIRKLLREEGLNSSDMVKFIEEHPHFEKSDNRHNSENIKSYKPFQNANLIELVNFLHSRNEFDLTLDQHSLNELRKRVMHEKQFIEHRNHNEDTMDYDLESFKDFRKMIGELNKSSRKIRNYIELKTMK
jgi:hypothetical protein